MAEAKKTKKAPAKVSKRKAGAARKTKSVKTKLTKQAEVVEKVVKQEAEKTERVLTERHKRVLEKAKVRSTLPAPETVAEVDAVKITDMSGVVYELEEWNAMVDMYDSTIKDIKEGEVVSGTVMGVTRDDVIVDVTVRMGRPAEAHGLEGGGQGVVFHGLGRQGQARRKRRGPGPLGAVGYGAVAVAVVPVLFVDVLLVGLFLQPGLDSEGRDVLNRLEPWDHFSGFVQPLEFRQDGEPL